MAQFEYMVDNLQQFFSVGKDYIYTCKLNTNIVKLSDEHIGFKFVEPKNIKKMNLNNKAKKDLNNIK